MNKMNQEGKVDLLLRQIWNLESVQNKYQEKAKEYKEEAQNARALLHDLLKESGIKTLDRSLGQVTRRTRTSRSVDEQEIKDFAYENLTDQQIDDLFEELWVSTLNQKEAVKWAEESASHLVRTETKESLAITFKEGG